MEPIITIEKLQETATYKSLVERKELRTINMLETRVLRAIISHGYIVYKNTGIVPNNIKGTNLSIVCDLVSMDK